MGLNELAFLLIGMGLGGIVFVVDRFGLILCSGLSIFGMILFYIGIAIDNNNFKKWGKRE